MSCCGQRRSLLRELATPSTPAASSTQDVPGIQNRRDYQPLTAAVLAFLARNAARPRRAARW